MPVTQTLIVPRLGSLVVNVTVPVIGHVVAGATGVQVASARSVKLVDVPAAIVVAVGLIENEAPEPVAVTLLMTSGCAPGALLIVIVADPVVAPALGMVPTLAQVGAAGLTLALGGVRQVFAPGGWTVMVVGSAAQPVVTLLKVKGTSSGPSWVPGARLAVVHETVGKVKPVVGTTTENT